MSSKHETSPAPELKSSKKRVGRESSLTDDQQTVVASFFPAWEQLLRQHKLHLGKGKDSKARDPEAVTSWINQTIKKIQNTKGFVSEDNLKTNDEWAKVFWCPIGAYLFIVDCCVVDSEGRIQESPSQRFHQE